MQVRGVQFKKSIFAFGALPGFHMAFARTLSRSLLTHRECRNRSGGVTLTLIAAKIVVDIKSPEARFAVVTDPSGHTLFALAQFALNLTATAERRDQPSWIAIASLAKRVVVVTLGALVTCFPDKTLLALTLTAAVTSRSDGSIAVTVTS